MLCRYPVFSETVGGLRPCGQCLHCRKNNRRKKTTRLLLESQSHEHVLFVHLTYSNDYLPVDIFNPCTGEIEYSHPAGCLDKRAVQLFFKRLRRRLPPSTLRYFGVGEYGEQTFRPHYHFILFGLPYEKRRLIFESWKDPATGELMCNVDRLKIEKPRNDWHVAQYCCGYLLKKMNKHDDPRLEGRPPEFSLGSVGIGLGYVETLVAALKSPNAQDFIAEYGDIPRTIKTHGKELPLDRYMRGKILEKLQISETATETAQTKFSEEMSALLLRASHNPQISKAWLDDPMRRGWMLEKQFLAENAEKMKVIESKDDLYNSKKRK